VRRCGLCNRPLRDRESIELGFGPTCWHRLSVVAGPTRPPTASVPRALNGSGPPVVGPEEAQAAPDSPRGGTPGGVPVMRSTQEVRSDAAPVAVAFGWLVVVAAMLALVEYWRWVLVGLAVLVGVAVLGVLLEWLQARRHQPGTDSARARSSRR
jgi:hypothetical protein